MIQIITRDVKIYKENFNSEEIDILGFDEYKSFDLYEINIIDLSSDSLWACASYGVNYLNDENDLSTIKNSISTCNAKVVILFPQNLNFKYDYDSHYCRYNSSIQLKAMQDKVGEFISKYIYVTLPRFKYEKGITKINDIIYNSDFYFEKKEGIISCEGSKKVNTIRLENKIVITTLNIFNNTLIEKNLFTFLDKIEFLENKEIIPQWLDDISFYDDNIYKENIEKSKKEIERLNNIINENENKLKVNLKYKSILYSSGSSLSEQVNEMLKQIFNLKENFVDTFEEDFNFKFESMVFVVETKGLNNEVTGKNVSDAYNHLIIYDDELESKGSSEETKCLFFVANERFKNPQKRNKIKERQITIAKRNKTLIIETTTLYKLFEDFIKKEISTEDIYKLFKDNVGLLEYKDKSYINN